MLPPSHGRPGMIALIDADILLYRCGFAAQKTYHTVALKGEEEYGDIASFPYKKEALDWAEETVGKDAYVLGTRVEVEPLENALHNVKTVLQGILEATNAKEYTLFLTGKDNFREEVATILPYKGNRDPSHKPAHYDAIKEYLISVWKAQVIDGQEADDALAQHQTDGTVIVTIDKDLDMVPGWHYNFVKGEMYNLCEEDCQFNFYKQMLTGDTVDNIPGVPGIGPVKADKILLELDSEYDMYCAVAWQYALKYDDPEAALEENAQLLWMRRVEGEGWKAPARESVV